MGIHPQRFDEPVGEREGEVSVVEERVVPVDGCVMVRADEHHVVENVLATSREPLDVVAVTEPVAVASARIEKADLAPPVV